MRSRLWSVLGTATGLWVFASIPAANAGCAGWGCQPACGAPVWLAPRFAYPPLPPCVAVYPPQPVYRALAAPPLKVVGRSRQ